MSTRSSYGSWEPITRPDERYAIHLYREGVDGWVYLEIGPPYGRPWRLVPAWRWLDRIIERLKVI